MNDAPTAWPRALLRMGGAAILALYAVAAPVAAAPTAVVAVAPAAAEPPATTAPPAAGSAAAAAAAAPPPPGAVAAAPDAALAGLAFMAGCWEGVQEGVRSEECWLAPAGGLMLGMHRDLMPGGKVFFEFLRIEAGAGGVVYLASPRGAPATPFPLAAAAPGRRAEFANPRHDFPQRIIYEADGGGRLKARVEGPSGGGTRSEAWTWTQRR